MYREMSFFVFNNCLFFDSEDRVQFFFSTWDFVEPDVSSFDTFMDFIKRANIRLDEIPCAKEKLNSIFKVEE